MFLIQRKQFRQAGMWEKYFEAHNGQKLKIPLTGKQFYSVS